MIRARGVRPRARRLVLVHDQHRRGAVGDLRRRAGGVQAVGQHGLEALASPSSVVSRSPWSVSTTRVSPVGLPSRRDRRLTRDLALEPALVDRDPGLLLRGEAERVEVGAGQAAAAGDPVGGLELVGHVDRPSRPDGGRPARAARWRRAGSATSTRRRRRCRRRWCRRRSCRATRCADCWPEPHWASTVVAPVRWGSPAYSQARRTMSLDCSPAWVTQPPTTWSTSVRVDARRGAAPRPGRSPAAPRGARRRASRSACRAACGRRRRSRGCPWAQN